MKKFCYSTVLYPFDYFIKKATNQFNLEKISAKYDIFTLEKDQSTHLHRAVYNLLDTEDGEVFLSVYRSFIDRHIKPLAGEPFLYQTRPTFRFHLQGNLAVGEMHRDRDYNHNSHEVNIYVPLTRAFDSNTIWIESEEGKNDLSPIEAEFGEYIVFDGANLLHGNKLNETGICRVSFDFRILLKRFYEPGKKTNTGRDMNIGSYWSEI